MDLFCVAETASGKVRGLINAGIRQFKGIPYGDDTSGRNRFRPPVRPAAWPVIRDCFGYGPVSPQAPTDSGNLYGQLIHFDLAAAEGGMGEDCLHLNIWTPGLNDGGKRPVVFSIHGGGFALASGNAALYDGAQLAKRGDAVVVAVTHRLSCFGYLDLPGFEGSGVAGILDLVLALEWVRDNIAAFGGDPGNVTIMGQSGGGWKVSILLAMEAAKGLFQRAIVQSGSGLRLPTREEAAPAVQALLAELGADAQGLRDMPWQRLLEAQAKLGAHLFSPIIDGAWITHHPCDPAAPEESRDLPLMVSTTTHDAGLFFADFDLDEASLSAIVGQSYGDPSLVGLYRKHYPNLSPYLLKARIITDAGFRRFAYAQGERKAAQGAAPVYLYQWDWGCPGFGGRFGAVHGADISATFHNVRDPILGAGHATGIRLADELSDAVLAFARSGDPGWPAFTTTERAIRCFGEETRTLRDPDGELRRYWDARPMAASVFG